MPLETLPAEGKLIFHRYGDRYFLSQMWMPGNPTGRELPPSKAELETARTISQGTGIEVAAKVKR